MEKTRFRNGIRYSLATREKAIQLRRAGKTHREIVSELRVSLGSASLWTREISLSQKQKLAIQNRKHQHKWNKEDRRCVSRRLKVYWCTRRYRDKDLIKKIKRFYAEHGRIPLKREFNSLRTFREHFGSWNNAIRIAGFTPNPVLFSHKFVSRDGHPCDSFTEMIIDDWLNEQNVQHERNWKYGTTKMTADFFIQPDVVIEFFGLAGVQKKYDEVVLLKKNFCYECGYKLIALYPKDIFWRNKKSLATVLGRLGVGPG